MKTIAVTGASGFLARNLVVHLRQRSDCEIILLDRATPWDKWKVAAARADVIFHLAGVNRPQDPSEFEPGNAGVTDALCGLLRESGHTPKVVFSSSTQAEQANPYGRSKAKAEDILRRFAEETGAVVCIYRLKNLFGKWSRPEYNAVTSTFCHHIANGLPIVITDPSHELELSYVDDVVEAFLGELTSKEAVLASIQSYRIRLGDLADRIRAFHAVRETRILPDLSSWFARALYATYLSYVPAAERRETLETKVDGRGSLAEFLKQPAFGQIFLSRTKAGVTRGNHFHHTKCERFLVVEGTALIRMRPLEGGPVDEYRVSGTEYQVVQIPPGFTHSITNVGEADLVTLFWSSEIFDPQRPDTQFLTVDLDAGPVAASLERV